MAKLLEYDPVTKTKRVFHSDTSGENYVIESRQDVTAVVELTRAEFNAIGERAPWKDLSKVARVPLNTMAELMASGIWYDDDALNRWLDDPDQRKLRTRPGRLSR